MANSAVAAMTKEPLTDELDHSHPLITISAILVSSLGATADARGGGEGHADATTAIFHLLHYLLSPQSRRAIKKRGVMIKQVVDAALEPLRTCPDTGLPVPGRERNTS